MIATPEQTKSVPEAISLIRVSGDGQLEDDGPDRQRASCARWAARTGYHLAHEVFGGKSQSGSVDLRDRIDLMECLAKAEELGIDTIVCEDYHRLSRDSVQNEVAVREFQAVGVRVFSATSGIELTKGDASDPTSKFVRQMLAAVAELEKDTIVGRMKSGRTKMKAETGRCEGAKPYGDRPEEEEGIAIIKRFKAEGPSRIASRLNSYQIPTRSGGEWHCGTVSRILTRLEKESA